jgi:hypothetical protein
MPVLLGETGIANERQKPVSCHLLQFFFRRDLSEFQRFSDLIGQWKYLREMHQTSPAGRPREIHP